jgi:hypothetical protein
MDYGEWRKSTRSGNQANCVMVRHNDASVQVKDSKNPEGPVLTFTRAEWIAFIGGAVDGEFDLE